MLPEIELEEHERGDLSIYYPTDPKSLPSQLAARDTPVPFDIDGHVQRWIAVWNSRNLECILDQYGSDIVFESPLVPRLMQRESATLRGKQELALYFRRGLDAYPDLHFTLLGQFYGANSCVIHYESVNRKIAAETHVLDLGGKIVRTYAHYL